MYWVYLFIAIGFEVAGTTAMKLSQGFAHLVPSVLIFVFYGLSFYAMTYAVKKIDVSIAYPVWAGVGTVLIVVIGIAYFREPVTALKALSTVLVIAGVIGLTIGATSR